MNFKTLFGKYAAGTAIPEEETVVRDEIEKVKLILSHIEAEEDSAFGLNAPDIFAETETAEIKKVKHSLNKKTVKIIIAAVAALIAVTLLWNYAVIPVGNLFFYDPQRNNFTMDVIVSTKLSFPGYRVNDVKYVNEAIGKHTAKVYYADKYGNGNNVFTCTFKYGATNDMYMMESAPWSAWDWISEARESQEDNPPEKSGKSRLEELPDYLSVSAYVSFERDLTMDELIKLDNSLPDLTFIWAGVRTTDSDSAFWRISQNFGFDMRYDGLYTDGIEKKYPYIVLSNHYPGDRTGFHRLYNHFTPEVYENHFKTLLDYMADSMIKHNTPRGQRETAEQQRELYVNSRLYVEEHGVNAHGVLVKGRPADILSLYSGGNIRNIVIDNLQFESYSDF